MNLNELETLCRATRYRREPPTGHDVRESEAMILVIKLIAVARAAQAASKGAFCDDPGEEECNLVSALDDALTALEEP